MKQYWVILFVSLVILAALTSGCAQPAKTYTVDSKSVNTSVNEEFTIALESNPTTGYSWQNEYDKTKLNLVSDEYKAKVVKENIVGSGGTQYIKFKALKSGTTNVIFSYRRPWMQPSFEDKIQTFNVTVK